MVAEIKQGKVDILIFLSSHNDIFMNKNDQCGSIK